MMMMSSCYIEERFSPKAQSGASWRPQMLKIFERLSSA
jgi:hypothetical protein